MRRYGENLLMILPKAFKINNVCFIAGSEPVQLITHDLPTNLKNQNEN